MNVKRWLLVWLGEWHAGGTCVAVRDPVTTVHLCPEAEGDARAWAVGSEKTLTSQHSPPTSSGAPGRVMTQSP